MAVDLNAAIDSASRVMGLFHGIDENKRRQESHQFNMKTANERMDMARAQEGRETKLFDARMAEHDSKLRSERVKQAAGIFSEYEARGMEPPDELYAKVWPDLGLPDTFLDEDYGKNLDVAEGILQGKVKANSKEGLDALNQLFKKQVMAGNGVTKDGKRIVDKRIAGAVPSPDGKGFMLDLQITTEDGQVYNAPVTEMRDSDADKDPYVKVIPWEAAMDNLAGQRMVYGSLSPEKRQRIKAMVIGASGLRQQSSKLNDRLTIEAYKQNAMDKRAQMIQGMRDESARRSAAADESATYQQLYFEAPEGQRAMMVPPQIVNAQIAETYGVATPEQSNLLKQYERQGQAAEQMQYMDGAREQLDPWGPNFLRGGDPSEEAVMGRAAENYTRDTGKSFDPSLLPPNPNRTESSPGGNSLSGKVQRSPAEQPVPKAAEPAKSGDTQQAPRISSKAEYDALPSGTRYVHPDGTIKVKK